MDINYPNNWEAVAMEIWPEYRNIDLQIKFKGGMKDVLGAWKAKGGATKDLVQVFIKLNRLDILNELKAYFPAIR
jgi:hypothetical protein